MAYRFKHGDRPLEDYTIQRAVGAGGFGEVYYAISDGGREVALKYLKENPEIELRGVGHTINLKSPHLVTIFDVKKSVDGDYFIIMEYCSGPSLRDLLIAESNGFKPEKAAFFVREIAKGLSHLHDRGIVHRDLKPGNIFYDDGYVKIGDYGLSKFISVSRHSAQTASIGTVHYMAPEIGSGNYSHSVDIYALGVMLYEMLLGRVPFEGASMGEVLMKHLTSQPEVDNLPQPFAAVIRKALIKDPKDRYQSVDEMVSDMLAGEELQNSVAGFRPASLTVAVNHGGPAIGHSPMPSPNPIPGHVRDFVKRAVAPQAMPPTPPPFAVPLNERLARKMEKLSNKVERKMAKLAGKRGGGFKNASQLAAEAASEAAHRAAAAASSPPQALAPSGSGTPTKRSKASLVRRIFVGCLLTAGVSFGFAVIVAETYGGRSHGGRSHVLAAVGIAAGLLIPALAIGIAASRSILRRWRMEDDPYWTKGLVRILVSAGPLAIALMPMFAGHSGEVGAAIFIGLLATAVLGAPSWEKVVEGGSRGELNIWGAAWSGLVAMFFTAIGGAIMDCDPEEFVLIAGGAATAAHLVLQMMAWFVLGRRSVDIVASGGQREGDHGSRTEDRMFHPAGGVVRIDDCIACNDPATTCLEHGGAAAIPPFAQPANADPNDSVASPQGGGPRYRWGISRAFWGLSAFVLIGGSIVTFLMMLLMRNLHYDDRTGVLVGCIACLAMSPFALRKTTPIKRDGFWRETLRPFLQSVTMLGIGACITFIARHWSYGHGEEKVAVLCGLIFSSIFFLALLVLRGGRRRPRSFVRSGYNDIAAAGAAPAPIAAAGHSGPDAPASDATAEAGPAGPPPLPQTDTDDPGRS